MEGIVLLFLLFIILGVVSLLNSKGDILSPSVIITFSFSMMLMLLIICYDYFSIELYEETIFVLISSTALFLCTEILVERLFISSEDNKLVKKQININKQILLNNKRKVNACLFFSITNCILIYLMITRTFNGSLVEVMHAYKTAIILGDNGLFYYRFFISQLYKIQLGMVYVVSYALVYNSSLSIPYKLKNRCYLIIMFYIIASLMFEAARQPTIEIILFIILCNVLLSQIKSKWIILKKIIQITPIAFILGYLFFHSMTLVGRTFHEGKSVVNYIAEYFCGGLYSFNLHIFEPCRSSYFGKNSFVEIYLFLSKLGFFPKELITVHEFDKYGNTSTIFGRWYEDFGLLGVYIMTFFVAWGYTVIYSSMKKSCSINIYNNKTNFKIIIYCFLLISLCWAGYDDRIKAVLSTTTVLKIIIIYFMYKILIEERIRFKIKR